MWKKGGSQERAVLLPENFLSNWHLLGHCGALFLKLLFLQQKAPNQFESEKEKEKNIFSSKNSVFVNTQ